MPDYSIPNEVWDVVETMRAGDTAESYGLNGFRAAASDEGDATIPNHWEKLTAFGQPLMYHIPSGSAIRLGGFRDRGHVVALSPSTAQRFFIAAFQVWQCNNGHEPTEPTLYVPWTSLQPSVSRFQNLSRATQNGNEVDIVERDGDRYMMVQID